MPLAASKMTTYRAIWVQFALLLGTGPSFSWGFIQVFLRLIFWCPVPFWLLFCLPFFSFLSFTSYHIFYIWRLASPNSCTVKIIDISQQICHAGHGLWSQMGLFGIFQQFTCPWSKCLNLQFPINHIDMFKMTHSLSCED